VGQFGTRRLGRYSVQVTRRRSVRQLSDEEKTEGKYRGERRDLGATGEHEG